MHSILVSLSYSLKQPDFLGKKIDAVAAALKNQSLKCIMTFKVTASFSQAHMES